MSKLLADLLDAEQPLFGRALKQLEQASGNPSADVRLTAEIISKLQLKTQELGLDPRDTTGPELFAALQQRIAEDDARLAGILGLADPTDAAKASANIIQRLQTIDMPRSCWVLKKSVAKDMLKAMPPPTIMKTLKYKSVASMLKNEPVNELYGALRFAEGPDWLEKFLKQYSKLSPSNFESRPIELCQMPADKWGNIADEFVKKKRHNVTHLKELGVVLLLPVHRPLKGASITILPLVLHYFNEIRLYSAFFKLQQVKPDFGDIIVDTLIADPPQAALLAGNKIHWRVIQRYFGKLKNERHPEIFEPHVQPEDLHWRRAESLLAQIDSHFGWWLDLDYVAGIDKGRPVSLNLMDAAISFSNNTPYNEREVYHFRESLWNEIFARYMGEKTLEQQVLRQLDNNMIAPEVVAKQMRGRFA